MFDENWLMTKKIDYRSFSFHLIRHIVILLLFIEISKYTYQLHLPWFQDCLISVTLLMFFLRTLFKNEEFNFFQKKSKKYLLVDITELLKTRKELS